MNDLIGKCTKCGGNLANNHKCPIGIEYGLNDLLPCPFCGYEQPSFASRTIGDGIIHSVFGVICPRCQAKTAIRHHNKWAATESWNSRV